MKLTLGSDIGGTNTRIGAVTQDGNVIARTSFATTDYTLAADFADRLASAAKTVMAEAASVLTGVEIEWLGLGIGAPNGNYYTGNIEEPPNLTFKGVTPIEKLMHERLNLAKIELTNDANAAAVGEKIYGGAKNFTDFIMITLGTGLGSGVYVNNQLVYGHDGFAGEIGHITVIPDGRYCGFGRRGSLESYCSATGIRRTFFEMIAELGTDSLLDSMAIDKITSKKIAEAAAAGDKIAKATFDFTGRLLGEALASTALVTSPAAYFLFGGPVQAGEILLNPLRSSFEQHLIPTYKNKIEIKVSELPMGDAAILGAAALLA